VDAEAPRSVRRRLNDTALVAPAAYYQELDIPELRVMLAADFDEECVEVDM
jgi:hypothetical protein